MENFIFTNLRNFRYERKFFSKTLKQENVEAILKFHPAMFKEIYQARTVNNIYFDSLGLNHYRDNIDGVSRRLKVRIRWYGEMFGPIEKPILELKIKHNLHTGKIFYSLIPFVLDNKFTIKTIKEVFKKSPLPPMLKLYLDRLTFSLLNTYRRKYFLSRDNKYRITMDIDRKIFRLSPHQNNFLYKYTDYDTVILELKYGESQCKFVNTITNFFPFRITRGSKYIDGINQLYL